MKRGLAWAGLAATLAVAQPAARHSGTEDMSAPLQAMQRDDTQNPGMLWVQEGEAMFRASAGNRKTPCAGCHADRDGKPLRGVAARYPAFDTSSGRPLNLAERINACRERHQDAPALAWESRELLALESYVGFQSRGLPITPPADPRLALFRERGAALYRQRIGQLDLSCAQCHDGLAGRSLGGSVIPQGHPTGYPLYRLEWQEVGSLQRRLRNCMTGVRAEAFGFGARELVELELYLASRAAGLAFETPAVRP